MNLKLVVMLVLATLAAIFIVQNVAAVQVSFLIWSLSMSRALLIFFSMAIGFVFGWFLYSYLGYRKKKR